MTPFSAKRILVQQGQAPVPAATWTRSDREFRVTIRNDDSSGGRIYVTSNPAGGVDDAYELRTGDVIDFIVPAAQPYTQPVTETAYVFADANRFAHIFVGPH
ncbi:hypothetical protein [Nocardia sp. NPDC050793]|uniref:hypothetical protein n=1 Tax=Nocardia sp. NPDC050793 TaxID=3155159 RepID=UPI0033F4108A